MRIRLTRKLADTLDGIDVSNHAAGDILELTRHEAELLIAEGWAEQCRPPVLAFRAADRRRSARRRVAPAPALTPAIGESSERVFKTLERLREERQRFEQRRMVEQDRRRAEDRIREELHDARSRIVS